MITTHTWLSSQLPSIVLSELASFSRGTYRLNSSRICESSSIFCEPPRPITISSGHPQASRCRCVSCVSRVHTYVVFCWHSGDCTLCSPWVIPLTSLSCIYPCIADFIIQYIKRHFPHLPQSVTTCTNGRTNFVNL